MAGREKRKRKRRDGEPRRAGAPRPAGAGSRAAGPAPEAGPSKSKDELAREQLAPLREGERPLAVTIGAAISTALGVATLILFALGVDTDQANFSAVGTLLYVGVILVMAWGMWTVRYWAVLGFQALLALLIVIWSLLLLKAESVLAAGLALLVIGLAGTLFWFLVKSLARVQMPDRRPPGPSG